MPEKLNLTQVHQFKKVNLPDGRTVTQLVKVDAYIRLGDGDGILYIQRGQVFPEAGPAVPFDEIPGWFWNQLRHCSSESLIAAGWQLGSDPEIIKKALAEQKKATGKAMEAMETETEDSVEPNSEPDLSPDLSPDPELAPAKKSSTKKTVAKKKAA